MKLRNIFIVLLLTIGFVSCENEDYDDSLQFADPADLIAEGSEVFELFELMATDDPEFTDLICIEFIYPFTGIIYNDQGEEISRMSITLDIELSMFLGSVEEGQYINISFPIMATLDDGTVLTIADKDSLKSIIDACLVELQQGTIAYCESTSLDCVWEVQLPEGSDFNTYENAIFDVHNDLTVTFYYRGTPYQGTWIFYYIANELHVNIFIDNPDMVGQDWNFDWRLYLDSDYSWRIVNGDKEFELKKECDEADYCTTMFFDECEIVANPGFAEFPLEEYIPCIEIIAAPQDTEDTFNYSFYLTDADANDEVNAINTDNPYTNVINPQVLFVRIENDFTGEYEVVTITLFAAECPD